MPLKAAAVAILLSGAVLSALHAQSLADAARREEARRKSVKPSGKIITNKDLPEVPPPTAVVPAPTTPGDSAAPSSPDTALGQAKDGGSVKADADKADKKDAQKDEKYWSGQMKALREQLERDRSYAEALQSRINGLTTDFVNRDDPAQRAVIATDRQKALAELDRVKKAVVDDTKAIADFEEEARRASVPPGWLR
jgi:hypothetical protein